MGKYNSIKEFFIYLNENCKYLVLRNWDDVFNEKVYGDTHEDIDILCEDIESFKKLTNAHNLHKRIDRDNYVVTIGDMIVRFDVRHIGDEYYPKEWQQMMLERRNKSGDIFVPEKEDYLYSLIYHALLQKRSMSDEYRFKIFNLLDEEVLDRTNTERYLLDKLKVFIKNHGYVVNIPTDPGVFVNYSNMKYLGGKLISINLLSRIAFRLNSKLEKYYGFCNRK